jgi:hypothetical protein
MIIFYGINPKARKAHVVIEWWLIAKDVKVQKLVGEVVDN